MNRKLPFYMARAEGAKLSDISTENIARFIEQAKEERDYSFSGESSSDNILKQLVLGVDRGISNAALMLFGKNPQRFCPAAVVKCSHYYGTDVTRPIPSHQVFGGTLFAQTTESIDFVLSKLNRIVGGREDTTVADTKLEIPKEAVREIIVNAVVHRDYDSNGSVQVTVFSDRVEIMNPGTLPEGLTVEDLAKRHISIPVNPFLARPFYLAGYINQLGYGTENVVKWCRKAGLPEPAFEQLNQQFCVTIWRNWLTRDRLGEFNLHPRQADAIRHLQEHGRINNTEYQEVTGVAKRTALRDLKQLMELGLIERIGTTGKGTYYILSKGAIKGPKGPRAGFSSKRNRSKS